LWLARSYWQRAFESDVTPAQFTGDSIAHSPKVLDAFTVITAMHSTLLSLKIHDALHTPASNIQWYQFNVTSITP
jgi:hypothetical protein